MLKNRAFFSFFKHMFLGNCCYSCLLDQEYLYLEDNSLKYT